MSAATYGRSESTEEDKDELDIESTESTTQPLCCSEPPARDGRGSPARAPAQQAMAVPAGAFYATYHGHSPVLLRRLLDGLLQIHGPQATAIFLAGDSSLDNKTWLFNQGAPAELWRPAIAHAPATNGLERLLAPPRMVCDVCYWMNRILCDHRADGFVINTAIEATTLASRVGGVQCCMVPTCGSLFEQELLIRERLRPQDMLVISIGGNDVALAPSIFTVVALLLLILTPWPLLSSWHPAVAYFVLLFRRQVQCYAERLTARTRPARIGVCMIYNLDEHNGDSWASLALCALCYCCFPGMLQVRLRLLFELGTSRVEVPGSQVVPIALADALDGRSSDDYHQRVEPSLMGGQKMARLILHRLGWQCQTPGYRYAQPPESPGHA